MPRLFIYFITLYNIFNEFLEDISEDVLPNEATDSKSSVIWNKACIISSVMHHWQS